jgi:fatty acid desaturase
MAQQLSDEPAARDRHDDLRMRALALRLAPMLLPLTLLFAVATNSMYVLRLLVSFHIGIIILEWSVGRIYAYRQIPPISSRSPMVDELVVYVYAAMHLGVFLAVIVYITDHELSQRQLFTISVLFSYSVTPFGATAAHELLHRTDRIARYISDAVYVTLLYPHFPTIHLANHHEILGENQDFQTPKTGRSIYVYLAGALIGGIKLLRSAHPRDFDRSLRVRLAAASLVVIVAIASRRFLVAEFLFEQAILSFMVIETINYIQHYRSSGEVVTDAAACARSANQDTNYITRLMLLNLSLHIDHHDRPWAPYSELSAIGTSALPAAGYWTSFWAVWAPPLWNWLNRGIPNN